MTDALFIALDLATLAGAAAMVVLMTDLLRASLRDREHRIASACLLAWALTAGGWAAMLAGEDALSRLVVAALAARFGGS